MPFSVLAGGFIHQKVLQDRSTLLSARKLGFAGRAVHRVIRAILGSLDANDFEFGLAMGANESV